jgi:hypothetical protein
VEWFRKQTLAYRPPIHMPRLGHEKPCQLIALRPHSGLHNLER